MTVALAFFIGGCSDGRRGVNPGDSAPEIKGVDPSGAPLSLQSIQGKVILLNFWATWCTPCMAELPGLQALYDKLKDKGFVVVGVALDDTPENVKEAQAQFNITYPILMNEGSQCKRAYEIKGLPESYVLDSEHKVLVVQDPEDGAPLTKIIGPREWSKNRALQVFQGLLQ
jgi:thiol-disulfide isomerase/thioredoxin